MRVKEFIYGGVVIACMLIATTSPARAGIIFADPTAPTDLTTYGFGAVNPVLTMQNDGFENVCTVPGPSLDCSPYTGYDTTITGGVNPVSAPKYTSPTLGDLGITGYTDIGILFNVNEPNNVQELTLQALTIAFFDGGGSLVYSFSLEGGNSVDFLNISQGQGAAGYVGTITQAQADAAPLFNSSWTIGLGATAGCLDGLGTCDVAHNYASGDGAESITVVSLGNPPSPPQVPEPSTYLLFGAGLMAMGYIRRRRNNG